MTALSNTKSTAYAMNSLNFSVFEFFKARKQKDVFRFLFHTFGFPQLVENAVENLKSLHLSVFSVVEKSFVFQPNLFLFGFLSRKRKDFSPQNILRDPVDRFRLYFPQIFSHFLLFNSSTFQEFPQRITLK